MQLGNQLTKTRTSKDLLETNKYRADKVHLRQETSIVRGKKHHTVRIPSSLASLKSQVAHFVVH